MTRWLQAAKQEAAPRTKLTERTKPTEQEIEGGATATGRGVLSVSSVLSEGGKPTPAAHIATLPRSKPDAAPAALSDNPDANPNAFLYGTACNMGLYPRTWTGRVVSLDEWRELTGCERHGPSGRHWNAATRRWERVHGGEH